MNSTERVPVRPTPLDVALGALAAPSKPLQRASVPAERVRYSRDGRVEVMAAARHRRAVDGCALRASDLVGASSYTPLPLVKAPVWVEAGDRIPAIATACSTKTPSIGADRSCRCWRKRFRGRAFGARAARSPTRAGSGRWRPGDLSAHRPRVRLVNVPGGGITAKLIANGLRIAGVDVTCVEATARDVASIDKQTRWQRLRSARHRRRQRRRPHRCQRGRAGRAR